MKSVCIKGIRKLEVEEKSLSYSNGDDVIIDVKRTGICGSDIHYWDKGEPKGLVMGHEYSGVVTCVGNRKDLKIGDRVTALPISPCGECPACLSGNIQYCLKTWDKATGLSLTNPGGFAPKMAIRSDMVIKIPDNVTDEEACMTEPTAVGLHAVHLADIKVGDKVLIIGGGIIGLVSGMFAKMEGASYIALSETNKQRGKKSVKLDVADEWFDALDSNFMKNVTKNCPFGFDVVIECCGNSSAVSSALMAVRPGGKIILVGVSLEPVTIPTVISVMHELTIYGAIAYTKEEFQTCLDLMSSKKIDVLKFLDRVVGLEKVQSSFEQLTSNTNDAIKIIVDPNK